jgi:hypothetical protein
VSSGPDEATDGPCRACQATFDRVDAIATARPDRPDGRRPHRDTIDAELAWRAEIERWQDVPGATFERATWEADQARPDGERLRIAPEVMPPWVVVPPVRRSHARRTVSAHPSRPNPATDPIP